MNRYETVCIVRPDVGDDVIKGVITKASELIAGEGGEVLKLDEWGRRRLAYPIMKKNEGYYFVLTYSSLPETSKEIERSLRLNEDVLRYQTVKLDESAVITPAEPKKETAAPAPAEEKKETENTETAGKAEGGENGDTTAQA